MQAVLDVLNNGYEIAHLAENHRGLTKADRTHLASNFRAKLDTLGTHYEAAKTTEPTQTALLSLLADIRAAVGDPSASSCKRS